MLRRIICHKIFLLLIMSILFCYLFSEQQEIQAKQTRNEKSQDYVTSGIRHPDIQFEQKVYNFGTVKQDEKITHIYNFQNMGDEPLIINNIDWSCGCIEVDSSLKKISPGESGWVKVIFDTQDRQGRVGKTISIHSNDPDEPIVKLRMRGYMQTEILIKPRRIYFGGYKKDKPVTKKLRILQGGDKKIKLLKVEAESKYVTSTEPAGIINEEGNGYQIEVGLSPDVPIGRLRSNLVIYTDSKTQPVVNIPVNANVSGDIVIKPTMLVFSLASKQDQVTKVLKILSNSKEEFKILKIEDDIDYISTKIFPLEEGRSYQITVEIQPDIPLVNLEGKISIHTNYSKQPVFEVPINIFNSKLFNGSKDSKRR